MVVQVKSSSDDMENNHNSPENPKAESALNVLSGLKKRQKSSLTNGVDSLEILRSNVQYYFNSQVDLFMKSFIDKFFQPAIKNIKENTDEIISENQVKEICKNLLDNAKSQYTTTGTLSSSPATSSRNTTENEASDSENSDKGQSLLHQALKRKRTDSENENLCNRRFFIATTSSSYFNNAAAQQQNTNKTSLLTSALTSPPKRPIFHLISSSTNRGSLKSSHHAELISLLKPSTTLSQNLKKQEDAIKSEDVTDVKIKIEKVD